jgi:hypothetical protein
MKNNNNNNKIPKPYIGVFEVILVTLRVPSLFGHYGVFGIILVILELLGLSWLF